MIRVLLPLVFVLGLNLKINSGSCCSKRLEEDEIIRNNLDINISLDKGIEKGNGEFFEPANKEERKNIFNIEDEIEPKEGDKQENIYIYRIDGDFFKKITGKNTDLYIKVFDGEGNVYEDYKENGYIIAAMEIDDNYYVVFYALPKVEDSLSIFCQKKNLTMVKIIESRKMTNCSKMFYECCGLKSIDLSGLDTSIVTEMTEMFFGCENLKTVDISNFNMTNVEEMTGMFEKCDALEYVKLVNFNMPKLIKMDSMFYECKNLRSVKVCKIKAPKLKDMSYLFYNCNKLEEVVLVDFYAPNLEIMKEMFCDCNVLKSIDLSGIRASKVNDISNIFKNCTSLKEVKLITTKSEVDEVNVDDIVKNCPELVNLDLGGIRAKNVDFSDCNKLDQVNMKWN